MRLHKLLKKLEAASKGSPELDLEFTVAFPSAPPNVTRSIDAVVQLIEMELPGWWWTCGYCTVSNDASLYPPGSRTYPYSSRSTIGPDYSSGPKALRLTHHPKWGRRFDQGFHRDLRGGTVPISMLIVFLEAKIMLAKAALSTDPKQVQKEEREAVRASKAGVERAKKIMAELGLHMQRDHKPQQ